MPDAAGVAGIRLFEPRDATRVLVALLLLYAVTFVFFYPATITVADEGNYVRQAQLLIAGSPLVDVVHPITGESVEVRPLNLYPLGTAMMLVPFVWAGGREAAYLLSLVCTLAAVGITARWLHEQRYSPLWAVLVLAYPATLIMGRIAMSEAPSLLAASLGLWLFWRGRSHGGGPWLGSGFVAGFSVALREANALLFAPLFIGAVARRERGWLLLVLGGVMGLGVRVLSSWLFFDDPFHTKPPDDFSLAAIGRAGPLYLLCLLALVPGGLVSVAAYRGSRRPEVIATVVVFVAFHLAYGYSGEQSGWAKRLVLGPRYFVPLLPLLALTAAEVWPRWARAAWQRRPAERREATLRGASAAVVTALVALGIAIVGVQWAHAGWTRNQATIREAIYANTHDGAVLVSNTHATGKFMDHLYGQRLMLNREIVQDSHLAQLLAKQGAFYVVFLDRSDSGFWRENAQGNARFMARLRHSPVLLLDLQVTPTDHLRIWRVGERAVK